MIEDELIDVLGNFLPLILMMIFLTVPVLILDLFLFRDRCDEEPEEDEEENDDIENYFKSHKRRWTFWGNEIR